MSCYIREGASLYQLYREVHFSETPTIRHSEERSDGEFQP